MRGQAMKAAACVVAVALSGCGPEAAYEDAIANVEISAPADQAKAAPAADAAAAPAPPESSAPAPVQVQAPQIAYSYDYGLELPADRVPDLMRRHERACVAAGPALCQVIESSSVRHGRDSFSARLELRAVPAFLTRFRAGLDGDAEGAGGRVTMAATESEDLTRSLTDTEARLRALTTLRNRLEQLLANRSAPLEQLLATERELARVQGELDATQSALTSMRTRVATSRVTIDYRTEGTLAPDNAFSPVTNALENALSVFMGVVGGLILFIAAALPIALLVVPAVWLLLRLTRKARARRAAAKAASKVRQDPASPA